MKKADFIINKINKISKIPIESKSLFKRYILESLEGKNLITFYNWECPPRILDVDEKGKTFVDYCVNLEKVFRGEKIDDYTEIPRIVEEKKKEIEILRFLKSLGLKFRFIKLIADTNAYYITPYSLEVSGEEGIEETFLRFKRKIGTILKKDYKFIETKAYLFTTLLKEYRKEYENAFVEALKILDSDVSRLINLVTWNQQKRYIKGHLGFKEDQQKKIIDITKKTIATYGAEGAIFDLLSKTEGFSNCTWINIEEANKRTIEITNCLRKKKGISELPIIFPK